MTNEEAKERIQALYNDWLPVEYDFEVFDTEENKLDREAFALAIEALKAQPTLDTRQRERQLEMEYQKGYDKGWEEGREAFEEQPTDALNQCFSCEHQIIDMFEGCWYCKEGCIGWCEGKHWIAKQSNALERDNSALERVGDAVSKEAVEKLKKYRLSYDTNTTIPKTDIFVKIADIKELPSVLPQRKQGHWIDTGSGQICSQCKEIQYGYDTGRHFCPNCGAEMGGEEDG